MGEGGDFLYSLFADPPLGGDRHVHCDPSVILEASGVMCVCVSCGVMPVCVCLGGLGCHACQTVFTARQLEGRGRDVYR